MEQVGELAATKQTWRKRRTVREVFSEIREAFPNAGESVLRAEFKRLVRESDDDFDAVCDYAFDAAIRAYETQRARTTTASQRATKLKAKAVEAERYAKAVEQTKERILLLNLEMPNGKRMRFCSGAEMGSFGDGYRRIAKKVGRKLVGEMLDETGVRELMKK
jgi:hypothetical protein